MIWHNPFLYLHLWHTLTNTLHVGHIFSQFRVPPTMLAHHRRFATAACCPPCFEKPFACTATGSSLSHERKMYVGRCKCSRFATMSWPDSEPEPDPEHQHQNHHQHKPLDRRQSVTICIVFGQIFARRVHGVWCLPTALESPRHHLQEGVISVGLQIYEGGDSRTRTPCIVL